MDKQEAYDAMRDERSFAKYRKHQQYKGSAGWHNWTEPLAIGEAYLDYRKPLRSRVSQNGITKEAAPSVLVSSGHDGALAQGKRYAGSPPSPRQQSKVEGAAPTVSPHAGDALDDTLGRSPRVKCSNVSAGQQAEAGASRAPSAFFSEGPDTDGRSSANIYELPRSKRSVRPPSAQGRYDPIKAEWTELPCDSAAVQREASFRRWIA